ncbi:MAG: helix-turn-helix domain-containing protein [Burkholderiales bacterium]
MSRITSTREPSRLPRGRHPLTQQAVADSQRLRLLDAVAHVVARKGYAAATVADVIAHAGVSRRTFYEQFADLEACFLAAYEDGMLSLFEAIRRALVDVPAAPVEPRIRRAVEAYLAALASRPEAAWAFTIEVLGAGREALDRHAWVMAQWVARWRTLQALRRNADPRLPALADARLLALVGGCEELVRETLRREGAAALPRIAADISAIALVMLGIAAH